jgi:hypothetical protein
MPRKYTKKSPYWDRFNKQTPVPIQSVGSSEPELVGTPLVSTARRDVITTNNSQRKRRNKASKGLLNDRYSNIEQGLLPYDTTKDGVDVRDAILLCQKAYANIALFRNVIDMMAEFSNGEIYLDEGSKKSRNFFNAWLKKIGIWKLGDQYFREYFRGGNLFILRIDGKFKDTEFVKLIRNNGATKNNLPLRYVLLNPYDIIARSTSFYNNNSYEKVLSEFDIEKLKNPTSEEDKDVFDSLPAETKKKINKSQYAGDGITMPLPVDRMHYGFFKKQDYEPFAIPFGFPVLADLNMKQEFKNMDAAILRTVENVVFMITTGAEPDKGGINYNNIAKLQELFRNESVGRVLVADYTTEAEFIIPDLNKVLGEEKYKVLNQDIKDGLQNIMLTDDSHTTADIKTKVFLDRLKEARHQFLFDFLQKEVDRVGKNLGFRQIPKVKFKDIDMKDDIQLMRIGTRLMEVGVLTPQQGMEFLKKGQLPTGEEIEEAQVEFTAKRKKGHFNPLVGGVPMIAPPDISGVSKTPQARGRPLGATQEERSAASEIYAIESIKDVVAKTLELEDIAQRKLKEKFGLKELDEEQGKFATDLCEAVVCAREMGDWEASIASCVENISESEELGVIPNVEKLSNSFDLSRYASALLHHSSQDEVQT